MNIGVLYVITAAVCLIEIGIIINRTRRTKYKETIDKAFCNMLYFFSFFCCVDILWGLFSSQTVLISKYGFTFVSYGFHSVAALSAYVWFGYVISYTNTEGAARAVLNYLRHILILVQVIVIGSNYYTHDAFWIDDNCNYYTGKLRTALYMLQYSYYIILIIFAIIMYIRTNKDRRYSDAIYFSLVPLGFGILQFVFYDGAMYSLGFMFSAFLIYSFTVTSQRERFMEERYNSNDRRQSSIIYGLAGKFEAIYYVDIISGAFDIYKRDEDNVSLVNKQFENGNYFDSVIENGSRLVIPEELEEFITNFSKESILSEVRNNGSYTQTIQVRYKDFVKYFQYRFVKPISDEEANKLIVGVYDVDEEVRKEFERLEQDKLLSLDAMTELYNRRAYEDDVHKLSKRRLRKDLAYISLDLNELKLINDNLGHEAGDELISGAAKCMNNVFGKYGKVYRVGGDEFAAIININENSLKKVISDFDKSMSTWKGIYFDNLSISYGIVAHREVQGLTFREVINLADKRMYTHKAKYYASKGIDRKGQQEAYSAVCNSYTKILKINLTTDRFSEIQMDLSEKTKERGYNQSLSKWLLDFAYKGNVHEDDVDFYLSHVEINHLRKHFGDGNKFYCIYYKRLFEGQFSRFMMEIMTSNEYTDENQILFLYVKNIER